MVCQAQSTCADQLNGAVQGPARAAGTAPTALHAWGDVLPALEEWQEQPATMRCAKPGYMLLSKPRKTSLPLSCWPGNCSGAVP